MGRRWIDSNAECVCETGSWKKKEERKKQREEYQEQGKQADKAL